MGRAWGRLGLGTVLGIVAIAVLLVAPGALSSGPGPFAPTPLANHAGPKSTGPAASAEASALGAAQASLSQAWGGLASGAGTCVKPLLCPPSSGGLHLVSASSATGAQRIAYNPPPLIGASIAYDPTSDAVLLFGGRMSTDQPSDQTWEYSGRGAVNGSWLNLTPYLRTAPGPRWDAMMSYDPKEGYVLLFGGCSTGEISGMCVATDSDTWDFQSGIWTELIPSKPLPPPPPPPGGGGPPPPPPPPLPTSPGLNNTGLWDASMVYDPNFGGGSVVIFGGADGLQDRPLPPPGSIVPPFNVSLSDWTYAWAAGAWTNISGQSSTLPPEMYGAGLVAGLPDGSAVLFGGSDLVRYDSTISPGLPTLLGAGANTTGIAFNVTWIFSATGQWSKVNFGAGTQVPSARFDFDFALDPSLGGGTALLYGGVNGTGAFLDDLWTYAATPGGPTPGIWTLIPLPTVPGATPPPRWNGAFGWDPKDNYFLLYGGEDAGSLALPDAWLLVSVSSSFFIWLPGAYQPVPLPITPGPRFEGAAAFDDYARSVVLFGGESCDLMACHFLGDTWTYFNGQWTLESPTVAPSPRFGAAIAYDPWNGNVYLFGGCGAVCPLSDTWIYHQSSPSQAGTWTQVYPLLAPPGRYFATMAYDPGDQAIVLFGGCEGALGPCPADDTWTLSGTDTWSALNLPPSASPPARFGAAATTVPGPLFGPQFGAQLQVETGPEMVVFGGMGTGGLLEDTWVFAPIGPPSTAPVGVYAHLAVTGTRMGWQEVQSPRVPDGRVFGTLAYDGADNALVLFGGCGGGPCPVLAPWNFTLKLSPPPPPGQVNPPNSGPWFPVVMFPSDAWNAMPGALYGMTGVWDPEGGPLGYVLDLGGRSVNGATMGDPEIEFSGMTWLPTVSFL